MNSQNPFWLRFTPAFIRTRLDGRSALQAIIHNTGWLLGDKALRIGLGLLVNAWVARYLGPSQFGELAYVLSFVALFQVVSELGLDGVVIRDMARDKDLSAVILGSAIRLRFVVGCLCWVGATGTMALIHPDDHYTILLTGIVAGSLLFQAADTVDLWFQSQVQSKRTVLAKSFSYTLTSFLKVILILSKAPLLWFAMATVVEMLLSVVALYFSYRRYPTPFEWEWDWGRARQILQESWMYIISNLAIIVYMRIDQLMLRDMMGAGELGVFSAALPLSMAWFNIPMIVYQSVGPSIARRKEIDPDGYEKSIMNLFAAMWWVMLPLSIIISLGAGFAVELLYGDAYAKSAQVLAVHVFANIPVALGVMQSLWILNEKRYALSLNKAAFGAVVNIALNLILIKRYGAVGAAWSTLVAQWVSGVMSNIFLAPHVFRMQVTSLFRRVQ